MLWIVGRKVKCVMHYEITKGTKGAILNKREFLAAAAAGAAALSTGAAAQQAAKPGHGPALLTVTGAVAEVNRGPFDPALDQMMSKQKLRFDKAHAFDFDTLMKLPRIAIRPTLEYDGKPHDLAGPLLAEVLKAAGAPAADATRLLLRAVDGYAVATTLADVRRYRFIVGTHLDGRPMALGGLGPLWAVYDADRFPEMVAKPVNERFGLCPWALYHINVEAA